MKTRWLSNLGLVALALAGMAASGRAAGQDEKELIFYNAKVFTAEAEHPYAEAVALRGDKIVAVGTRAEVAKAVGKNAASTDLQGNTLLPGLIDSHIHAVHGGLALAGADVGDRVSTVDQLVTFVAEARKAGKGRRGDILYISGLPLGIWSKTDELNAKFSTGAYADQPLILRGSDGHTAWGNKNLLQKAGITKEFLGKLSEGERAYYGAGPDSQPNGFAVDAGLDKLMKVVPEPTQEQWLEAGRAAIEYLHSLGITAWLDPLVDHTLLATYKTLSERGELTVSMVAAFPQVNPRNDPAKELAAVQQLRKEFQGVPHLIVPGFKIFADGVVEYPSQTAALTRPYKNTGRSGDLLFDPARFSELVTTADKQGLIVHIHALGDRAVKESLNAIEAARKANGNSHLPHTLTHVQLADPEDFPRFEQLGVIAALQLLWAEGDEDTIELMKPYVDPELYRWQYPARSLLDAGAVISGASDWFVSSPNVFLAMHRAETRKGPEGVLDASQRMPREAMLYAYTRNSARAMNQLEKIGSIAPGKQADLVLLDRDVMTVPAEELLETKVLWTMVGGKTVWTNAAAFSKNPR
ncbi:MAG TPA: amidohydrolase [Candidatus Angelobacter sp.]|nr:amidohydrolase [Candidatus Angelobacter sp.]